MNKILSGGLLQGRRTYIVSGVGIISALASYLVGDINLFEMMTAIYPLCGIYFLRRGIDEKYTNNKGGKNASTRKISK